MDELLIRSVYNQLLKPPVSWPVLQIQQDMRVPRRQSARLRRKTYVFGTCQSVLVVSLLISKAETTPQGDFLAPSSRYANA
jgi:phage-related protein